MIFISYNHKDQQLVDMVARQLEITFGKNNIFYDRWSMQPGDSIIGKMNEGLEQYTTFFYFLSTNSLESDMVTREWQSALMSSVNSGLKFVPIRLDDCNPPAIMKDLLYIDLYGIGIDDAISQMKAIVNQENNYKPLKDKNNLTCYLHVKSDYEVEFEIRATMFSVQDVTFGFICNNEIDDFHTLPKTEVISSSSKVTAFKDLPNGDRQTFNMETMTLHRVLTPSKPLKGIIKSEKQPLNFGAVMHVVTDNDVRPIISIWR
nr:toll/interleukin-1 receptor domain-containing protein [Streptococcus gallolyticus]